MRLRARRPNPATSRTEPCCFVAVLTVAAALLAGCGWSDGGGGRASAGDGGDGTVQVLAAASLADAFTELGEQFEYEHPGAEVELSFGSSTDLAEQAADGAPGDVLATADGVSMAIARDAGAAGTPTFFATNRIVIVTPAGNPAGVGVLADLRAATWVRCADEAPCGRAAAAILEAADVDVGEPASLEEDVRSTLDKVVSGEADAALVYASDAVSAGNAVETISVPGSADFPASYYAAPLEQAEAPALAEEFVTLVRSEEGQQALVDAGFGLP